MDSSVYIALSRQSAQFDAMANASNNIANININTSRKRTENEPEVHWHAVDRIGLIEDGCLSEHPPDKTCHGGIV